jgi:pyridoxal phosphate enzyme (YggS family)
MVDVAANYQKLVDRIGEAAAHAGRDARQVKLLAASKAQSIETIRAAVDSGITLIGENYVQEAEPKKRQISVAVEWHMIGHLQRNKATAAVEIFDVIESLDSLALARDLDKEGRRRGKVIRALVEVNLAGEETKSGIPEHSVAALLQEMAPLANLRIEGLMTVPPFKDDLEEVRPYFRALRELKNKLTDLNLSEAGLNELSMGMTHDFPVAIEEGATIVRIGTALFGPRGH